MIALSLWIAYTIFDDKKRYLKVLEDLLAEKTLFLL